MVEERIYLGSYEVWRKKNSSGALLQERQTLHVLDGERRAALIETLTWEDETELSTPETRIRYQRDDHLGTACIELDEAGATISYEEYHPYGTTAWYADDGTLEGSPKRYRYTGMERDDETGLQYQSARYYAPWLGRRDRADPIGISEGNNRLAYVQGSPVLVPDPSGLGDPDEASDANWLGEFATWWDSWDVESVEQEIGMEPGKWYKIHRAGWNAKGQRVSVHYFESQSGQVTDINIARAEWISKIQ